MNLILATSNPHKVSEMRTMLLESAINLQVFAYNEIIETFDIDENGMSFAQNANIKLLAITKALLKAKTSNSTNILCKNCVILAEDSGLCVEALHNEPHIYSARYAAYKKYLSDDMTFNAKTQTNHQANTQDIDSKNLRTLILALQKNKCTHSKAHFIAHIALVHIPKNCKSIQKSQIKHFEGRLDGIVIDKALGTSGFGYDPIFIPEKRICEALGISPTLTLAQMSKEDKNRLSHRSKALQSVFAYLSTLC